MTVANFIRSIAAIFTLAIFITDYGLNLWAKEVPTNVYWIGIAFVLGVDVEWFRKIVVDSLTRSFAGKPGEDK